MRYITISTAQTTTEALPRDVPLVIDLGLAVSLGVQNLPSNTRRQLWMGLNELAGSFCGGVQVSLGSHSTPGRPQSLDDGE